MAVDGFLLLLAVRDDKLGRLARRQCSPIGDQIGDGYIYFMSNGTDDRDVRGVDSLGDAFLIEGPEVFQAAAASANDHNVHREAAAGVQAVQAVDRPRDLLGGA